MKSEVFNINRMNQAVTRRDVLRGGAKGGVGLLALALIARSGAGIESVSAANYYVTGTYLNLRSGASLTSSVLLVMPQSSLVTDLGEQQGVFRKVSYKGTTGWASIEFLIVSDANGNVPEQFVGAMRTKSAVNFRSGPGTGYGVYRVLPAGTIVQSSLKVVNGFRFVSSSNQAGYIADSFLEAVTHNPTPATRTATTYLNLRAEPSLSAKVLMVLPPYQIVTDLGESRNGFRKVSFQQITGWASETYLK